MNASKEEVVKAKQELELIVDAIDHIENTEIRDALNTRLARIQNFLEAAHNKLPTEAAFARSRIKSKK